MRYIEDATTAILKARYVAVAAPATQPILINKAAALQEIADYSSIDEWLAHALMVTAGWPESLRKVVLADMMEAYSSKL